MMWFIMWLSCQSKSVDSGVSCQQRASLQWEYFGDPFFTTYCRSCHSSDAPNRFGAPESINFDTYASIVEQANIIRDSVIVRESMPKGGGISQNELDALDEFLFCIVEAEQ